MSKWNRRKLQPRQFAIEMPLDQETLDKLPGFKLVEQNKTISPERAAMLDQWWHNICESGNEYAMVGFAEMLYANGEINWIERKMDRIVLEAMTKANE